MEFIPISILREFSGYRDRRSIKRWALSLGIILHKVGKNWCVVRSELDQALSIKYSRTSLSIPPSKHKATNSCEQAFLNDLQEFLSDL